MSRIGEGFILTQHARDLGGSCQLNYYGISSDGPFCLTYPRHTPLFFLPRSISAELPAGCNRKPVDLENFNGELMDALYFDSLDAYYGTRRQLKEQGVRLYESDVKPAERYLMERHIRSAVKLAGESRKEKNLQIWENPKLASCENYQPKFSTLSLDIETGRDGTVYSIAVHFVKDDEEIKLVFMRDEQSQLKSSKTIRCCSGEKELLMAFLDILQELDPDLIIGWHVIGFDLDFLDRRYRFFNIPFTAGRGNRPIKISRRPSGMYDAELEGRVVIDGPPTLRSAFFKFADYKLETVASELLGRGKDISGDEDKVAEIERRFREDKKALARYNLEDAVLVTEIFQKTDIINLLTARSLITGLPLDRVSMSVASFDYFMLPAIHRKNLIAGDVDDVLPGEHAAGGHVFTSDPGLYRHVVVLDFKSLYPTIMRTFFIDPVSLLRSDIDRITTPVNIPFSRTEHVLPAYLKELMEKRSQAKDAGNVPLSQAVKILMNSFYGVMGTPGCRFYHHQLPTAITGTGQWILKETAAHLESLGYNVLYGDTDSVFVCLKEDQYAYPHQAGQKLEALINIHFRDLIKEKFDVVSRLEMEFEKHYSQFFLPAMRDSREGARKRYVGYLGDGKLELKGMEYVRSDWTDLAKDFQYELFRRFFEKENIKDWIKDVVQQIKDGQLDEKLVYRRKLNRRASDYTKTTPPHIKAVRMLDPDDKKNIRDISYLITSDGAVPVQLNPENIDYQHYIDKQIKPIADGVLFVINEDFQTLLEGRQLELF